VKPAETIIPMGKGRSLIVILAAIAGVVLTLRLGGWQLSRADEKIQYQSQLEAQMRLPPLDTLSLQQNPEQWLNVHRRVELFGTWLSEKTVYLDNRSHKGRPGFWVMTPFQWSDGQVVWVQRGWVARDPVDATKAAPIQTPTQTVRLEGRISAGLSHMTELKATTAGPSQVGELLIRSNLDRQTMQAMVTEQVSAVVVQTGANSDGLSRDWPVVSGSADKNKGYAFQWFALSGLIALLFIWFQWIGPWRHAKQQS
jgi:surfeit locus 1 family protein